MSRYAIKVSGGRFAGEYDGANTVEEAADRARAEYVPHVEPFAIVKIVHFSKDGLRVFVDRIVKSADYSAQCERDQSVTRDSRSS